MTWIDAGMQLSLAAAAVASILSMKMVQGKHNYESYSSQISGDVMNAIYSLQTMMSAYGAAGVRIIVTVDNIIAERIEGDE